MSSHNAAVTRGHGEAPALCTHVSPPALLHPCTQHPTQLPAWAAGGAVAAHGGCRKRHICPRRAPLPLHPPARRPARVLSDSRSDKCSPAPGRRVRRSLLAHRTAPPAQRDAPCRAVPYRRAAPQRRRQSLWRRRGRRGAGQAALSLARSLARCMPDVWMNCSRRQLRAGAGV